MNQTRFPKNIFMPFIVLGDPTFKQSEKLIKELIDNGAGALELGFAFSDPIADGPAVQNANNRALSKGITTAKAFKIIEDIRKYSQIPISVMLSFNIVYKNGLENFYKTCKKLGVNAVLCPDVPLEESKELVKLSKKYKINQIFLVSPTTAIGRMKKLRKVCSGYVYLVSLLGVTGVREKMDKNLSKLIKQVKKEINLPVYVGFGISHPEHVKGVMGYGADGVISGSAICKIIENNLNNFNMMKKKVGRFCRIMSSQTKNI